MSIKMRQEVERKIVGRFVRDALKAGYRLAVSLERGYDVDEMLLGSRDYKKIMEEAFAGDECHIFVQPVGDGPPVEDGTVVSEGWVYCVFGNDGWDVISDYCPAGSEGVKTFIEVLLEGAEKISNHYSN